MSRAFRWLGTAARRSKIFHLSLWGCIIVPFVASHVAEKLEAAPSFHFDRASASLYGDVSADEGTVSDVIRARKQDLIREKLLASFGIKFTVAPSTCVVTPNQQKYPHARHFIIECPTDQTSVDIRFQPVKLDSIPGDEKRKSRTLKVFDMKGYEISSLMMYASIEGPAKEQVQACDEDGVCFKFTLEFLVVDFSTPQLSSLTISESVKPMPVFVPEDTNTTVTLYANEPVIVAAKALSGFFVDVAPPKEHSGAIEQSVIFEYTPVTNGLDKPPEINLYVTNADRSLTQNYKVNVDAVRSLDPRLRDVSVPSARLDPPFSPDIYTYYLRVPEDQSAVHIEVIPKNKFDTQCSYKGTASHTGTWSFWVPLPPSPHAATIPIKCTAKDRTYSVEYVLTAVREGGGSTMLKTLEVRGATMDPVFSPEHPGPYTVRHPPDESRYVRFKAVPFNENAEVTVQNRDVDNESYLSPFFEVEAGDSKTFRVSVRPPENLTPQDYLVTIDRYGSVFERSSVGRSMGNWIGWVSTFFSSTSAAHFVRNAQVLQASSINHELFSIPPMYKSFAGALRLFNLDWARPSFVRVAKPVEESEKTVTKKAEIGSTQKDGNPRSLHDVDVETTHWSASQESVEYSSEVSQRENLERYAWTVLEVSCILTVAILTYSVVWMVYLSPKHTSSQAPLSMIRKDFPTILHPMRLFSFAYDYTFIGLAQATIGLFALAGNDQRVIIGNFEVSKGAITASAVLVLLAFPVLMMTVGSMMIFKLQKTLVFSEGFSCYHDAECNSVKAFYRRFARIPILRDLFAVEVCDVLPVMGSSGTPITFSEKVDTSEMCLEVGESSVCNARDTYQCLLEGTEYNSTNPAGADILKVKADVQTYRHGGSNSVPYVTRNSAVRSTYPEAPLAVLNTAVTGPYDVPIPLHGSVQIRHIDTLMSLDEPLELSVGRENLELNQFDQWNQLFGKCPKGALLEWVADHAALLLAILVVCTWNDLGGLRQTVVLACAFIAPLAYFLPSVLSLGNTFRDTCLVTDIAGQDADRGFKEFQVERMQVWPFQEYNFTETAYRDMRQRKLDSMFCGAYGFFRRNCYARMKELYNHTLLRSRAFWTTWAFFRGPAFQAFVKFSVLVFCYLGNRNLNALSGGTSSFSAILFTVAALTLLNLDSVRLMVRNLSDFWDETVAQSTRWCISAATTARSLLRQYRSVAKETNFDLFSPFNALLNVQTVALVQPNLGIYMPSKVVSGDEARALEMQEGSAHPELSRSKLQKVLHCEGGVDPTHGSLLYDMPVQVTTPSLLRKGATEGKCAATFHIVNHRGGRMSYPTNKGDPTDDSYLSLYTDPNLIPPYGKVMPPLSGHGYAITFTRVDDLASIVVSGPGIKSGVEYTLASGESAKDRRYSTVSSRCNQSDCHAEGFVDSPGKLTVPVEPGNSPDLHRPIIVESPAGEELEIDSRIVEVQYERANGKMHLYSRHLDPCDGAWKVTWKPKPATMPIDGLKGTSQEDGVVRFPWPHAATRPKLDIPLKICTESEMFEADPRDTDNHEFLLPEGMTKSFVSRLTAPFKHLWNLVQGDCLEEPLGPIACTIVQCVDPLKRVYRVEPNFSEAERRTRAKLEVNMAMKEALQEPEYLSYLAFELMQPDEFIEFWAQRGVNITGDGYFVNPMADPSNPLLRSAQKEIRTSEVALRGVLQKKLMAMEGLLTWRLRSLRGWSLAYADASLRSAVASRDSAEWSGDLESMNRHIRVIKQRKAKWEGAIQGFTYPMFVDASTIRRRGKAETQLQVWKNQLAFWLSECENASERPIAGKSSCKEFLMKRFFSVLDKTFFRPENLTAGDLQPMLHFVADSALVRGRDCQWSPDALCAHRALVRVWKHSQDTGAAVTGPGEPYWIPCMLKLDANRIVVSTSKQAKPDADLADTAQPYWKTENSWCIPLEAFEKVEVHSDRKAHRNGPSAILESMPHRLTFRKAQRYRIADTAVQNLADSTEPQNVIKTDDSEYNLLIGYTVQAADALAYPSDEVAPELTRHGQVNVYPLAFRLSVMEAEKWDSVIRNALLDRLPPHIPESARTVIPPETHRRLASIESSSELASSNTNVPADMGEESVSYSESAATSRSSSSSTVPETQRIAYRGNWKDHRFHGKGELTDDNGQPVYTGEWKNGKRDGQGTCYFQDHSGTRWKYEGFFRGDEICGEGKMTMVDYGQIDMLRDSNDPEHNSRVLCFEGRFSVPSRIKKAMSDEFVRDEVAFSPDKVKKLFMEETMHRAEPPEDHAIGTEMKPMFAAAPEHLRSVGSNEAASPARPFHLDTMTTEQSFDEAGVLLNHKRKVILDIRRVHSTPGDETSIGCPLHMIDRAITRRNSFDSVERRSPDGQDPAELVEIYLPQRSIWTRALDETLGYWDVANRFEYGTLWYANGAKYVGPVRKGKPHGPKGFLSCPVCSMAARGDWYNGTPHGQGALSTEEGTYWGALDKGSRKGRGIFKDNGETIHIQGVWSNDCLDSGHCVVDVDPTIAKEHPYRRYVGNMDSGLPEGWGKLTWQDKVAFKGSFVAGKREGNGTVINSDGVKECIAMWKGDVPHGRVARLKLPRGLIYCGQIHRGQRQGMGELYSGERALLYEGQWSNDVPDGQGTWYGPDGTYEGGWRNGKRQGKGRFCFKDANGGPKDGRIYEGDWSDDKPHGKGLYIDNAGFEGVVEIKEGVIDPKSLKKYRKGIRKAPSVKTEPTAMQSDINSYDPLYWGRRRKILPEKMLTLHSTGKEVWHRHTTHSFAFVEPGKAPAGPSKPRQAPLWDSAQVSADSEKTAKKSDSSVYKYKKSESSAHIATEQAGDEWVVHLTSAAGRLFKGKTNKSDCRCKVIIGDQTVESPPRAVDTHRKDNESEHLSLSVDLGFDGDLANEGQDGQEGQIELYSCDSLKGLQFLARGNFKLEIGEQTISIYDEEGEKAGVVRLDVRKNSAQRSWRRPSSARQQSVSRQASRQSNYNRTMSLTPKNTMTPRHTMTPKNTMTSKKSTKGV